VKVTEVTVKVAKPGTIQSLKNNGEIVNYNEIIYSKSSVNELLLHVNLFNKRISHMFHVLSNIFHLLTYLDSCVVVALSAIFVVLFV
jgi:hypothetical protein